MKQPCAYIIVSDRNGTLYIGATSNLIGRLHQHRTKAVPGFAQRYGVDRLVWYEQHETMLLAILREKQLEAWRRAWKIDLIEIANPVWRDLSEDIGFPPQSSPRT